MRSVRVVNRTRDEVLADRAELADNMWTRFWGLMGRRDLPDRGGLVLRPGGGVHSFWMRMTIDVIHVDKKERVTHVLHGMKPWRLGPLIVGDKWAIELPEGAAARTQRGDEIAIEDLA